MSKIKKPDKKPRKRQAAGKATQQITSEEALAFTRQLQETFGEAPRTKEETERQPEFVADEFTQQITSEEALAFVRHLQEKFAEAPPTKETKERLQEYVGQFNDWWLKAVGRRVQGDLMLRPPRTIRRKDFERKDVKK